MKQGIQPTTAPVSAPTAYEPVVVIGERIYVHITSTVGPGCWVSGRLKAIVATLDYAREQATDADDRDRYNAEALSMAAEAEKVAHYCDQNGLW